jgi:hypothetical protein
VRTTMGLDRRLREELRRDAAGVETDVERNLGAVEARSRRRNNLPITGLLVAAAIIAVAVIFRIGEPRSDTGVGPASSPTAASSAAPSPSGVATYPQIAGTYVVSLDPTDRAVARDGLGGSWTMRLQPDGLVLMSPPATFKPGAAGLTGIAFSLSGDRFRTNLFYNDYCNSVGTYTWALQAGRLSLTPVDDTCSIRRSLLATTPWNVSP